MNNNVPPFAGRQPGETREEADRRVRADRQRQSFKARTGARAAAADFRRREREQRSES